MKNSSESLDLPLSGGTKLGFNLAKNFYGELRLNITVYGVQLGGAKQFSTKTSTISIQVRDTKMILLHFTFFNTVS